MATLVNGNVIINVADDRVGFFPGRLKTYSVTASPLMGSVIVAGTEKLLQDNQTISLVPDENSILLKFGLLAYGEASPYDMMYILEGAEKPKL